VLVNGTRFRADKLAPTFGGVDLTQHIGAGITFSPTSTIHSYQGITFEGGKLYLEFNMVWDVRMLYVAVSRVRHLEQLAIVKTGKVPRYMGEGLDHRTEKARRGNFGLREQQDTVQSRSIQLATGATLPTWPFLILSVGS